jgi:metal-sulfur cluster biosynthetic enzyme
MMDALNEEIRAALEQVCDPCSIAANAPLSILDMGLIQGWSVDKEGNLRVRMCLTSPSCTMSPHIVKAAEGMLSSIRGVKSARVEVDPEVFWTPANMTGRGREILHSRRETSLTKAEVAPQQWRSRGGLPRR